MTADMFIIIALAITGTFILTRSVRLFLQFSYNPLPSFAWALLMIIPFIVEYLITKNVFTLQGVIILLFGIGILAADMVARRISVGKNSEELMSYPLPALHKNITVSAAYALLLIFLISSVAHIVLISDIPFLAYLTGHSSTEVLHMRNSFSRGMDIHPIIKYIFNFDIFVFGLPAFGLMLMIRHYPMAFILFLWILFYAVSGAAKMPLLISLFIIGVISIRFIPGSWRKHVMRFALVSLISMISFTVYMDKQSTHSMFGSAISGKEKNCNNTDEVCYHIGDYYRLLQTTDHDLRSAYEWYPAYFVYRVFFTPVEVSARWYEYFSQHPIQEFKLQRHVKNHETGEYEHPANIIGKAYFKKMFPAHYSDDSYAYASIDADAYARYGWVGVLIALAALMIARLIPVIFSDRQLPTHGIYSLIAVTLLTFIPANGSLQALLVSHGLILVLVILFVTYILMIKFIKHCHLAN